MGCFSCCIEEDDDDERYKDEIKTAMFLSRHEREDSRARLEIAEKEEEIDLCKENHVRYLDEQVDETKKKGKRKQEDDDQSKDDIKTALTISRFAEEDRKARQEKQVKETEQDKEKPKDKGKGKQEDTQFSKPHKKTFTDEEQEMQPKDDVKEAVNPPPPPASISDLGKSVIEGGKSINPQGLCCQICQLPFAMHEIATKGKYHKHCHKERKVSRNSICYVCKIKIRLTETRAHNMHPFWKEKYCRVHDTDGTPKCCSCERLEPKGTDYVMFDDYRMLCLQCMESSVMDSIESLPLHMEIRDFFEGLFLKIDKEFPLLMVDKQALNSAEKEEKIDNRHVALNRGLCLSEVQTVPSIITRPRLGPDNQLIGMVTENQRVSGCEVTGILIIYGLPRLLTGYILAHEMMHAWLRLNGYKNLKLKLEEGLCQALALRWLESQTFASTDAVAASSSSSHTLPVATSTMSKKGDDWTDFEKRFVEFCIYQIKEDDSPVYGQGFKEVDKIMRSNNYSLKDTLKEIVSASKA